MKLKFRRQFIAIVFGLISVFGLACKPADSDKSNINSQLSSKTPNPETPNQNTTNLLTISPQSNDKSSLSQLTNKSNTTKELSTNSILSMINSKLSQIGVEVDKQSHELSEKANEELSHQLRVEYKVFKFNIKNNPNIIEDRLNELGKNRWNCFHIEPIPSSDGEVSIFCKKIPLTAARLLPGLASFF